MPTRPSSSIVLALGLLSWTTAPLGAQTPPGSFVERPGELEFSGQMIARPAQADALAERGRSTGEYAYVEPNWLCHPISTIPNDTSYGGQWQHRQVQAAGGDVSDVDGHGTFVSGLSGAIGNLASSTAFGLVWSLRARLDPAAVEQTLFEGSLDLRTPGEDDIWGHGRVDSFGSVSVQVQVPSTGPMALAVLVAIVLAAGAVWLSRPR